MKTAWVRLTLLSLLIGACLFHVRDACGQRAVLNGRTISAGVKTIGGRPYVPLSDVARALGMNVVRKGDAYVLIATGGANQIAGRNTGRLGDELFTGQWRFKVTGVHTTTKYVSRFRAGQTFWTPASEADKLVIVDCRIKNRRPQKELVYLDTRFGEGIHTALADTGGHSYEPLAYDAHHDYFDYAQSVLPGAAIDFALVFSVPKATVPQSLVFTLSRYDDRGDPRKHTDVRVALR